MDVFTQPPTAADSSLPQIFRYGSIALRPHADYRLLYGNGIQATPGNQQSTFIQELTPGFLLNLGTHWAVDYAPTIRFYSSSQFRDTVDQAVALTGGFEWERWRFGVSHGSQFTTSPLAETGGQTEQSLHSTSITAARELTPQMFASFGVSQAINLVSGFQDSYGWSTMDWLNYQFWPRLVAGLGAGGGYVDITDNSGTRGTGSLNQTYETVQARVAWRATDKISFQISGGFEDRQFMTAGAGDSLNPVFGAAIQYQPFKKTQISLAASRTVSSSDYYLAAQQTEVTGVNLDVSQTVLRKFIVGAGVGYGVTDYSNASGAVAPGAANRSDDGISFNVRLSHPFFKRGTWTLFYQYSDNHSSQPGYSYQSNQTGFEISYRY
jgi:hypothetical protein